MELQGDRTDNIKTKPILVNNIGKIFIIAWKESTQELEEYLQKEKKRNIKRKEYLKEYRKKYYEENKEKCRTLHRKGHYKRK